jgi:hypothetical protein
LRLFNYQTVASIFFNQLAINVFKTVIKKTVATLGLFPPESARLLLKFGAVAAQAAVADVADTAHPADQVHFQRKQLQ